jgi:hypothetical protein
VDTLNTQLPLSVQDWPLKIGGQTPSEYCVDYDRWCRNHRGNWSCTRERNHPLPHVASDGSRTCAIWDQQYYGDYGWDLPMRVIDVAPLRRLTDTRYRRAAIELL